MALHHSPRIVTNGLVLCLDAGSRKSYGGTGNVWRDLAGSNNGTLTNGPTFSSANGGSIVFDGTNDYISFNSLTTQSLNLTSSNGATISCWLRLTILNRWTGVVTFFSGSNVDIGWDIQPDNALRIWKNGTITTVSVNLASYNNTWTYFTLVSNSTGTIFYVNDSQVAKTSQTGNVTFTAGRNLMFGDHWDNPIQGNASTLLMHNRALTHAEIQQNYNATKGRFKL